MQEGKYTYSYKGEVEIPPLGMVDDLICISECGHRTAMMNSYINFKTNSKKLQFGVKKCKKLHVGHKMESFKCQNLEVDKWSEIEIQNQETGEYEIKDIYEGDHTMEETKDERYLGDIISTDGKIIRERRLGFLHYIVNENKNSMIYKFCQCQNELRTSKDWVTTVTEDLKYLELDNLCFYEIKNMKKAHFMNKVKCEIKI